LGKAEDTVVRQIGEINFEAFAGLNATNHTTDIYAVNQFVCFR